MNHNRHSSKITRPLSALLVSISALLLMACSMTTDMKAFSPISIDDRSKAAIYVYRPKAMTNALYSPDLYIDDELKFPVKNGRYSRLSLSAGSYPLKLDSGDDTTSIMMSLEPGTTYYIRVTTSLKINNSLSYEPYQRKFIMEEIKHDIAQTEISECCMTKKAGTLEQEITRPDTVGSDGGFSVDKTQNPFSH